MFNEYKAVLSAGMLACLSFVSSHALAGIVVNEDFVRIAADATSGSGHTVLAECGGTFDDATAELEIMQSDGVSQVEIELEKGKPNTVYTVWVRLRGNDDVGSFGGSPLTGGGATPLAPGTALDGLLHYTPPNPGNADPTNGFTTNNKGNAKFKILLNFPLIGGAYPFNELSSEGLAQIRMMRPDARAIPVAIVNPDAPGVSGPFMIRIVSHCQDGLGHGLSPSNRESWFDWPR